MGSVPQIARRLLGEERGLTLIELLVVPIAALTVLSGALGLMQVASEGEARSQTRAAATNEVRAMLDGIVREVREGSGIAVSQPTQLSLLTWVHRSSCGGGEATTAIQCRVTYTCSAGTCTRTEAPPAGGGGSAVEVLSGIADDQIFSYSPSPSDASWVGIEITMPRPEGGEAVTLTDGAALRNEALGA